MASQSFGRPWFEPLPVREYAANLRFTPPGERRMHWLATQPGETDSAPTEVLGVATLRLTDDDNQDKAWMELDVHPEARRQGVGSMLLARVLDGATSEGRETLVAGTHLPDDRPDHPHRLFLEHHGFALGSLVTLSHRHLPVSARTLDSLDPARDGWVGAPGEPTAYRLVTVAGELPPELAQVYCDLANHLDLEAPTGEIDYETGSLTPDKLACQLEHERSIGQSRIITLAVHEATGAGVAYTELVLSQSTPRTVQQWGTLVHREHRGHRLGMAVKVANLRQLQHCAPTRGFVEAGNAKINTWMVAINEQLGFQPVEGYALYQRPLA